MKNIKQNYLAEQLWHGKLNLVYPEINSHEAATILSNSLQGAIAVIWFKQNEKVTYGVLCDFFEQPANWYENLIDKYDVKYDCMQK